MIPKKSTFIPAGIAVFLLIAAFLWSVQTVASPILIGGILIYLLGELTQFSLMKKLRNGILLILLIWILSNTKSIVIPFLVAFVFAYLTNPLVDFLERLRFHRLLAVSLIFLVGTGLLTLACFTLIPDLIREIQDLIVRLPQTIQNGIAFAHKHLPKLFALLKVDYLKIEQDFLQNQYPAKVESFLLKMLKAFSGMGTFLSQMLNVILIPVLTFYFLKDYNKIKSSFLSFVPKKKKSLINFYLWRSNQILGGYIRGKLIVCVILGLMTWLGLFLLSIPYAIMIAIIVGLFSIVPFVGFYVSMAAALLSSLLMPNPYEAALKILIVFLITQAIEGYVITPKIVGERVGLHPVAVIFSILIFSRFMGFWGLIIAVPAAALIKFLVDEWKRHQNWKEMLAEKVRNPKT
jgi:predicted PurR-regulated permease PerM